MIPLIFTGFSRPAWNALKNVSGSRISRFSQQILGGSQMKKLSDLELYSLTLQGKKIKPIYADARGNTFLIYDLINRDPGSNWSHVKDQLWDMIKSHVVDDAIVLRKKDYEKSDSRLVVKMHVLEPDRTEADFCGNAANASGYLLKEKYGVEFSRFALESCNGLHDMLYKEDKCFINMGQPKIYPFPKVFSYKGDDFEFVFVDAVEPHLVTKKFYDKSLLKEVGEAINQDWRGFYPNGVNVNCVKIDGTELSVMTYERGVYRITQACGTGSTACLALAVKQRWVEKKGIYSVKVLGGEINFLIDERMDFWLGGPVSFNGL